MDYTVVKYGFTGDQVLEDLAGYLTECGHPTTFRHEFDWHFYTRVLQFQLKLAKDGYSGWDIDDVDGIVGPKTWRALIELVPPDKMPEDVNFPGVDYVVHSPNQSERGSTITHIVLHNTAGPFASSVDWLCNPAAQASAHLVISRSGKTAKLVPFNRKAWHAGHARMNSCSIGIELEAYEGQERFSPEMHNKLIQWIKFLMDEYDIPAENIGIHRWYRNTSCPGLIWPTDSEFKRWRKTNFGA